MNQQMRIGVNSILLAALLVTQRYGLAQDPEEQAERVRAAMAGSLDLQRGSVQKQLDAIRATPAGAYVAKPMTVVMITTPTPPADCDPVPQPELTRMIGEASKKAGIDTRLVREVARQESAFRPCAVSSKGAQGLMQLMPATQNLLSVANPFDPQESLDAGSKLLKQLLEHYHGDLSLALSAYNAGIACVDQAGGVPNIQETRTYVSNILSRLGDFEDSGMADIRITPMPSSLLALGCQSTPRPLVTQPKSTPPPTVQLPSNIQVQTNEQVDDNQH